MGKRNEPINFLRSERKANLFALPSLEENSRDLSRNLDQAFDSVNTIRIGVLRIRQTSVVRLKTIFYNGEFDPGSG